VVDDARADDAVGDDAPAAIGRPFAQANGLNPEMPETNPRIL
jgi:hypothetical protein